MITMIGMSHLIAILKAYSGGQLEFNESDMHELDHLSRSPTIKTLYHANNTPPGIHQENPSPKHHEPNCLNYLLLPISLWKFDINNEDVVIPPEIITACQALEELNSQFNIKEIYCSIKGNDFLAASLFKADPPHDFIHPERQDLGHLHNTQIIQYPDMQLFARAAMMDSFSIYLGLRLLFPQRRIIHIVPPPPKYDTRFTLEHIPQSFQELSNTYGLNTPEMHLKYHTLYAQEFSLMLKTLEIECLPPPPDAVDTQGYLKPEYYKDLAHANQDYGERVLEQIYSR